MAPYAYSASNELTSTPTATYTYDNNGDTLTKTNTTGTTTYNWDFENRLASVVLPVSGGIVTFKYDPFGRRIQKNTSSSTMNYLYDAADSVQEMDRTGALLARYAQGPGIDQPLSELRNGATGYYQQDALGSVTSVSDSAGALANTYAYDSFGNLTATTTALENPFQYTGREYDSETGLRYYRARYYDAGNGRFLNEDPIGFQGGMNLYGYTGNNSINFADPTGGQAQPVPLPVGPGPFLVPSAPPTPKPSPWNVLRICAENPILCVAVIVASTPTELNSGEQEWIDQKNKERECARKNPCHPYNFENYAGSANEPFKGGAQTNAGSALQSHSMRGQGFPSVKGPASAWNSAAETLVEEILTNPNSKCTKGKSRKQGDYVQIRLPNGIGARWTLSGQWLGFIGP